MNIITSKKTTIPATPIFDTMSREYSRAGTLKVFYSRKHNGIRVIHPLEKRSVI